MTYREPTSGRIGVGRGASSCGDLPDVANAGAIASVLLSQKDCRRRKSPQQQERSHKKTGKINHKRGTLLLFVEGAELTLVQSSWFSSGDKLSTSCTRRGAHRHK
jgi:hypothetical protein